MATSSRTNEPAVLVLSSLLAGPKHGHALARDIEEFAGVRLGPGSLYGAITRLEAKGMIAPLATQDRRRPYQITQSGRAELTAVITDLARIVTAGSIRLGLQAPTLELT